MPLGFSDQYGIQKRKFIIETNPSKKGKGICFFITREYKSTNKELIKLYWSIDKTLAEKQSQSS